MDKQQTVADRFKPLMGKTRPSGDSAVPVRNADLWDLVVEVYALRDKITELETKLAALAKN